MTAALLVVVALLGSDLELPHVRVVGTVRVPPPQREFWPVPEFAHVPTSPVGVPRLPDVERYGSFTPMGVAVPAGFSIRAGAGFPCEGNILVGVGESGGGLALGGWRYHAGDLERRGLRAGLIIGGAWGNVSVRGQRWDDRRDGVEVAPGWAHGRTDLTILLARGGSVGATLTANGPHGDGVHGELSARGTLPTLHLPFSLVAGDRRAEATVFWDGLRGRFGAWAGPVLVDDGSRTRWTVAGGVRVQPVRLGPMAVGLCADRELSLVDAALLRERFPASSVVASRARFVPWRLEGSLQVRLHQDLWAGGSVSSRRIDTDVAWRETDEGWEVSSLAGEGTEGEFSVAWRTPEALVEAGVGWEGLRVDRRGGDDPSRWPLVPSHTWWVRVHRTARPRLRLELENDWGMRTWENDRLSARGVSVEAGWPLGRGWEAWISAGAAGGWRLAPLRRGVSAGLSWSTKRPFLEESFP